MDLSSWLSLILICTLGAVSPGPSLVAVMKYTVQGSRLHGLITAVSHATGIGLYAFLVAAGIAVVITESPQLFGMMTFAGAAYLAWMGYKSITSASAIAPDNQKKNHSIPLTQSVRDGFLIAFLNPKIAIFFLALFSQFVTADSSLGTQLLMALVATLCDGLWYCLVAAVAGHSRILPLLKRKAGVINKVSGVVLILIAARILFS